MADSSERSAPGRMTLAGRESIFPVASHQAQPSGRPTIHANQTARKTAAVLCPMAVRLTDMPIELFSRIGSRATGRRHIGSG